MILGFEKIHKLEGFKKNVNMNYKETGINKLMVYFLLHDVCFC